VARWSAPLVRHQFVGLAVCAGATGIALGGFSPHAASSQAAPLQLAALDPPGKSPSSPAPATAAEKGPTPTKGATVPTLERILANWKARKDRTRSLYLTWDSRMFTGQAATDQRQGNTPAVQPTHSGHVSYWAEGPDRSRIEVASLDSREPTRTAKWRRVWNGMTECNVQDPGVGVGPPIATLTRGPRARATTLTYLASNRLGLAFQPAGLLFTEAALAEVPSDL
jgi:hypothetical protein